jgi:DNA-directed RNA polymerase specialized sigma24 family protein
MLLPFEDTFRVFIPRSVEGKDFGHAAKIWRHARYQGVSDAVGGGGSNNTVRPSPRNPEVVNWPVLMGRLRCAAGRLVGPDRAIDCGVSSTEDLVSQVLAEFIASPNGCGWDGTEVGLTRLLCRMVQRRWIDHIRRDSKVAQDSETPLAAAICQELGPEEQVAADQMRDRLFAAVKGHEKELELRDFIQAALLIKDGSMVDKQMADLLDISPSEVRNRRKMLLRIGGIQQLGIIMCGESHEEQKDTRDN